jgi:tetratricopeptide (TPR) repeat protein
LALGYEGLLHHLSGNYDIAEEGYSKAIVILRKESTNFRALSIFHRHRGDLRRRQKKDEDARRDQLQSIAAAETGRHPALLHFSRVAMANLERNPEARVIIQQSLRYSLAIGLPKLEADTLKVEGEIALSEGETERAGQLAINCLGLACAGGMRLRVTAALILLGKVSAKRNDLKSTESLFRSAIDFGQRQGYQLQIEEAEQQLIKLGAVGATGLRP